MRIKAVILENFRAYRHLTRIDLEKITAFVGRNDSGKSTILEALAIFFESDVVKIDPNDANAKSGNSIVRIGCVFDEVPECLSIDQTSATSLKEEYLLDADGCFEVHKLYDLSKARVVPQIIAIAMHPTIDKGSDLLVLKQTELKKRVADFGITEKVSDQRSNPALRKAIWQHLDESDGLHLNSREIALDKEGAKEIWEHFSKLLPTFALFRADRPSTDSDAEVQDPMKIAVKEALLAVEDKMQAIRDQVEHQVLDVANRTLEKLREMDPNLANQLTPHFSAEPKWDGFKLNLLGDDDIPINKRGSGVRRLILLNFFRAEAERKAQAENRTGVIYAIEEPEVSQHPKSIQLLVESLMKISQSENHQVILTTHVPAVAGLLPLQSIRHVTRDNANQPVVEYGDEDIYQKVVSELGILPGLDDRADRERLKLLVCVEGVDDVRFLHHMCQILRNRCPELLDISNDPRLAVIPLYGTNLQDWVKNYYFRGKDVIEFHIYDKDDDKKYQGACDKVNSRGDKSCAILTKRLFIESYVHPTVINDAFSISITMDDIVEHDYDVLDIICEQLKKNRKNPIWKKVHNSDPKKCRDDIKYFIHKEAVPHMDINHISEIDPDGEILGWFNQMATMLL